MVSPRWGFLLHHHPPARMAQHWLCHCAGVTSRVFLCVSLTPSFIFSSNSATSVLLSLAGLKGMMKAYVLSPNDMLASASVAGGFCVLNAWFIICFHYDCSYLLSCSVNKGFVTWRLLTSSWILNYLVSFSVIIFLYAKHCFQSIQTISKLYASMIFCDDDKQFSKVANCL